MRHIYRATRMPDGRLLDEPAEIFDCPACKYAWAYRDEHSAVSGAISHCRVAGGDEHHRVLVDVIAAGSPLFDPATLASLDDLVGDVIDVTPPAPRRRRAS